MQKDKKQNICTFTVAFPEEKKEALLYFLEQNGGSLEEEIISCFDALYHKKVPLAVRKYLDSKLDAVKKQGDFQPKSEQESE